MKYRPSDYGKALAYAILAGEADEQEIRKNFLTLVRRRNDEVHLPAILDQAERILREKTGRRKVTLETARTLSLTARKALEKILEATDAVEEKIRPELVAGVRITVNEELQWDGSLAKKMQKLFAYQ